MSQIEHVTYIVLELRAHFSKKADILTEKILTSEKIPVPIFFYKGLTRNPETGNTSV